MFASYVDTYDGRRHRRRSGDYRARVPGAGTESRVPTLPWSWEKELEWVDATATMRTEFNKFVWRS